MIADPRYAVIHHSDGYSGLYGGATLVTAYRGTAIAALHYSGTAVRGGLLHRWNKVTSLLFVLSTWERELLWCDPIMVLVAVAYMTEYPQMRKSCTTPGHLKYNCSASYVPSNWETGEPLLVPVEHNAQKFLRLCRKFSTYLLRGREIK